MRQIHIGDSVNTVDDLPDLLRRIAKLIEDGYKSGYYPHWTITGDDEFNNETD